MAEENGMNENSENPQENNPESGFILNVQQIQSIDITSRFNKVHTDNGWIIHILEPARLIVNYTTSMRKFETALMVGDLIERDRDDIVVSRFQPTDTYRNQRSGSSLAKSREELLATTTIANAAGE